MEGQGMLRRGQKRSLRMRYLEKFVLPDEDTEFQLAHDRRDENGGYLDSGYPCMLFPQKELSELDFETTTILYGGNGSGKSTLLNVIAEKLALKRTAPFNGGELFAPYVAACRYRMDLDLDDDELRIPQGSSIIKSDDIFEYMLAARQTNEERAQRTIIEKKEHVALKFSATLPFRGLDDYEAYRKQVLARQKSLTQRKFAQKFAGKQISLSSNGETALEYFRLKLKNETLYLLDEPENSLSPKFQLEIKDILEEKARYCGCQFIIATHSPFLLALRGAKIYDLDSVPVLPKKWWELENTKTYFSFFYGNRKLFLRNEKDGSQKNNKK